MEISDQLQIVGHFLPGRFTFAVILFRNKEGFSRDSMTFPRQASHVKERLLNDS